jgi:hypothetical protein
MENNNPRIKNQPSIPETPIAITIPILPDMAAFFVSSVN